MPPGFNGFVILLAILDVLEATGILGFGCSLVGDCIFVVLRTGEINLFYYDYSLIFETDVPVMPSANPCTPKPPGWFV